MDIGGAPMTVRLRALATSIAAAEIWAAVLLLAASFTSTRALPIALGVALLFWPVRWLAYGHLTLRSAADWPAALLLLTLPVTLWATAFPDVTRFEVLRLVSGLALYYAIINWAAHSNSQRHLRWLTIGLLAIGLGLALIAPITVGWTGSEKFPLIPASLYNSLPVTESINPNVMAGALVLLLPLALALPFFAWRNLRWFERLLTVITALAMLVILVISKSRGGLLALGAVLTLLAVLRWRRGWLLLPGGVLITGIFLWWIGPSRVLEMLTASQALGGLDGRLEVWSRGFYMVQDFPFTGIGMGTFHQTVNLLYPMLLANFDVNIPHAHNLPLQVAVDLGLPGLIVWLAILFLMIYGAAAVYRYGKHTNNRWLAGLGAGLLGSQVVLLVHGMLDATVWGTRPAILLWAVWGLTTAAWNQITGLAATRALKNDHLAVVGETQADSPLLATQKQSAPKSTITKSGMKTTQPHRTVLLGIAALFLLTSAACFSAPTPAALPALQLTQIPTSTPTFTPTRAAIRLPISTPTSTPSYLVTTIATGETLTLGDLELTISPISTDEATSAAQPGRQLVLLDLVIQNTGEQLVSINAPHDFILKDSTDRVYRINTAAVATIRGTIPDVDLTPGEVVRAQLGFDLPANAGDLTLSFAADKFRAGRIFIRLPSISTAPVVEATPILTTTATLTATATLTPTETATPVALPSPTAQPTATAANVIVALLEPVDGGTYDGQVTFSWSVTGTGLPAGQAYEVVIYPEGQAPMSAGLGVAAPTVNTTIQVDLAGLDADPNFPLEPGPYLWGVRVIDQNTGQPLRMAAEGRRFIFKRF